MNYFYDHGTSLEVGWVEILVGPPPRTFQLTQRQVISYFTDFFRILFSLFFFLSINRFLPLLLPLFCLFFFIHSVYFSCMKLFMPLEALHDTYNCIIRYPPKFHFPWLNFAKSRFLRNSLFCIIVKISMYKNFKYG